MNNLSQVIICQDEVESPCELGMTENIIHGHSHVRGIQKYSKKQATTCRCDQEAAFSRKAANSPKCFFPHVVQTQPPCCPARLQPAVIHPGAGVSS